MEQSTDSSENRIRPIFPPDAAGDAVFSGACKLTTVDFKDTMNLNPVSLSSRAFKENNLTMEEV